VAAVADLSQKTGSLFINRLTLTPDNRFITYEEALNSKFPLTRIVIMFFKDGEEFNKFWESKERHELWAIGRNYAKFCDIIDQQIPAQNQENIS
jgi:hypothetical protein